MCHCFDKSIRVIKTLLPWLYLYLYSYLDLYLCHCFPGWQVHPWFILWLHFCVKNIDSSRGKASHHWGTAAHLYTVFYVFLIDATVFVAARQSIFSRQLHISHWTLKCIVARFQMDKYTFLGTILWYRLYWGYFSKFPDTSKIYPEMCKAGFGFPSLQQPFDLYILYLLSGWLCPKMNSLVFCLK